MGTAAQISWSLRCGGASHTRTLMNMSGQGTSKAALPIWPAAETPRDHKPLAPKPKPIVGDMDACLAETRPGTPTAQPAFARLLASVGINAISLSNVNAGFDANLLLLSTGFVQKAAALATVFGGGHLPHPVLLVAHDRGRGQPDDRRPLDPAVQERN